MGNFQAFGRSYSSVGESSSDFLIKTRGQVKIQWGNKFIDLIKDGKINVEASFIFKEDSVGEKDGIYVVGDGDEQNIWLVVDGEQINIKGEIGTTYVSFLAPQEVTPEQKYQALQNIGFIYPTMADANSANIQNGVVYVEETQKLYIIVNGSLTEYTAKLPNPVTEQFVIAKNDSKQGAILIQGEGIENSLAFNSFYIYSQSGISYVQTDNPLFIKFGDSRIIQIDNEESVFNNKIICDEIQSKVANSNKGFRIYYVGNESFLEVDNLIVRNPQEQDFLMIYPEFIIGENNVIKSVELTESGDFNIILQYSNNFEVGDVLCTVYRTITTKYTWDYLDTLTQYSDLELILIELGLLESGETYDTSNIDQIKVDIMESQISFEILSMIELVVTNVDDNIITVTSNSELDNDDMYLFINKLIFKKTPFNNTFPIRIKDSNIDIVEYESTISDPDVGRQATVKSRFGNLSELNIKETNSGSDVNITGAGIYSDQGYFKKAGYIKGYTLDPSDDSSKFASTEWVNNVISVSASSSKDIDLTFQQLKDSTDPDYTQSYLENQVRNWMTISGSVWDFNDIGKLISEFGDLTGDKSESFLCQNGFITLTIHNDGKDYVEVSAIVKAYTNSLKWSYRALHFKFDNDVTEKISEVHTFIIDDGKLNPGFYYSEKLSLSSDGPESPVYLGTIIPSGWEVDSTNKYLWYTTDGKNWVLQSSYVEADSNYIYIISTSKSIYIDSTGTSTAFPAGFVTYCSNIDTTQATPLITTANPTFGFDGYINPITITDPSDTNQNANLTNSLTKLKELVGKNSTITAKEGGVPEYSGFNYVWKIEKAQYESLSQYSYNSWEQANSFQVSENLIKSVNNSDWGNSLDAPGWRTFKINNNQIIADTAIDSLYLNGIGNSTNWNKEDWKIAFLRSILRYFLQENKHRYNKVLGWNFNYDGVISCTGYQGSWTARIGGIESPKENADVSDIDYYPTSTLSSLSGNVTSPEGIVHFVFTNVKLGKLRSDLGIGLNSLSIGTTPQYTDCLYDVDFEECKYKFESY